MEEKTHKEIPQFSDSVIVEPVAITSAPMMPEDNALAYHMHLMELFWNTWLFDYKHCMDNAMDFFRRRFHINLPDGGNTEWFRLWDTAREIVGSTEVQNDLDGEKLEKAWVKFGKPESIAQFVDLYLESLRQFEAGELATL